MTHCQKYPRHISMYLVPFFARHRTMLFLSIFLIAAMFRYGVDAYPFQEKFAAMKPNVNCQTYPQPLSYHVHITYMLTNNQQIEAVQKFRDQAQSHFMPFFDGKDPICQGTEVEPSGRYDNGRLCMIYDHDLTNKTIGPFAVGEWSMFVPVHYYNAVVPWFLQHRGQFDLLVHPNTGCEYEDHSIWAQWSGPAWNMDMSIFDQWTQTNEFGEYLGTDRNPSCLGAGGVCAMGSQSTPGYGPQVVCCAGSACACDSAECRCK